MKPKGGIALKKMRFLSAAMALFIGLTLIPAGAFADTMSFGGRSEVNWANVPKGKTGTVNLQSGKILKKGEYDKNIGSISASRSVFNQMRFNRGKDMYDYASDGMVFVYDTSQTDYGAYLDNGKYFYAIYNPSNNKKNYKVDFSGKFSEDILKLVRKGDLEMAIAAETNNYKGTSNKHVGIANLRLYASGKSAIQQELTTESNWYGGTREVSDGWISVNKDINRFHMDLRSERNKGLKKFNKSSVQKVRVFLRDVQGPKATKAGVLDDGFTFRSNVAGSAKYAAIGDTIKFYVDFDEKVVLKKKNDIKLKIKGNPEKDGYFTANCTGLSGNSAEGYRAIFEFKIPDNTQNKVKLDVYAQPVGLILNSKDCITDVAGNNIADSSIASIEENKNKIVDDTKTLLASDSFTDRKFYPTKTNKNADCNLFGATLPSEIKTNSSKTELQPVIFGKSTTGPIFRIVLNDEIQKNSLRAGDTKLKLRVYDKQRKATDKYVYAGLVSARTVGIDKNSHAFGMNSEASTELYFKYTPQEIAGLDEYYVNFAGEFDSSGAFTFTKDAVTCGNAALKNIANMDVDFSLIKVDRGNASTLAPLNCRIMIDTAAPSVKETKVSGNWDTKFRSDSTITFTDAGGFDTNGVKISFVYYDEGGKHKLKIGTSQSNAAETLTLGTVSSGNTAKVSLSDITMISDYPENLPVYIEYSINDAAGNTLTNADKKDIRAYIDSTGPVINRVSTERSGGNVAVKYDVTDPGEGTVLPLITYVLHDVTSGADQNRKTDASDHVINIMADKGSYNKWNVTATFYDKFYNKTKKPVKSEDFVTADRDFDLRFVDDYSPLSDKHSIKLEGVKIPQNGDVKFDISYGWVKGSTATLNNATQSVTLTPSNLNSVDFVSEEIQNQFGGSFSGEYTLFARVILQPEGEVQDYTINVFFDTQAPTASIETTGKRDGVNSNYEVKFILDDDGAAYKAYAKNGNIDFSSSRAPKAELFIKDKLAKTYVLNSINETVPINFNEEFGENEDYLNAQNSKIKLTVRDIFGHESTFWSNDMRVDFAKPEIKSLSVAPSNINQLGDGTFILKDFADLKYISAAFDDEAKDALDIVRSKNGFKFTERKRVTNGCTATVTNPLVNDFDVVYDKGVMKYRYTFEVYDMAGNMSSASLDFVLDKYAPEVTYVDTANISGKTNAKTVTFDINYNTDAYETPGEITIGVSGGTLKEHPRAGKAVIEVSENGVVEITISDKAGRSSVKQVDINCFDRNIPELQLNSSAQIPKNGAAKYGSFVFTAKDDDSLTVLSAAITQGEPSDNDFFTEEASARPTSFDENGDPTGFENGGYFGDSKGFAYAKLEKTGKSGESSEPVPSYSPAPSYEPEPTNGISESYNMSSGEVNDKELQYKLSYGALPTGTYNVYVRVGDRAGNVETKLIATINASDDTAELLSSYTPSTATGGSVTMTAKTDIPTLLQYTVDSEDNISAMQESVQKKRSEGYAYVYEGALKTITFEEACAMYKTITGKVNAGTELTDEEKAVFKNSPTTDDYLEYNTTNVPTLDIYDYLINECYYNADYGKTGEIETEYERYSDLRSLRGDYTNEEHEAIITLLRAGLASEGGDFEGESKYPVADGYRINVLAYPEEFDSYTFSEFSADSLTPAESGKLLISNPLYSDTLTESEVYEFFGDDFDITLLNKMTDTAYQSPFAGQEEADLNKINEALRPYFADYVLYKNPYNDLYDNALTLAEINAVPSAASVLCAIRHSAAELIAQKYMKSYMSIDGSGFTTNHILKFRNNINARYSLLDELGRTTELPVDITWIDPTLPSIPEDNIKINVMGSEFTEKYTNADSAEITVTVPTGGIYDEYYLADLPEGASGTEVTAPAEYTGTKPLYKQFTLTVTENGSFEFLVINPTAASDPDKKAEGMQTYVYDFFDREAPECKVIYSPQKPADGSPVNTDVTVNIFDIEDDKSSSSEIKVECIDMYTRMEGKTDYTFYDNGWVIFKLYDLAGNVKEIPVNVDYIDKTPAQITAKIMNATEDITDKFDLTADMNDYAYSTFNYVYIGGNLRGKAEAYIYDKEGKLLDIIGISDNGEYHYDYTSKAGNRSTLTISGIKFDNEAPKADADYIYNSATPLEKDSVTALVNVNDNITNASELKFVSVTGRDSSGKDFAASDVFIDRSGENLTASLKFANNGFAKLVFADAVGNTVEVSLEVKDLDRTPPAAYISYSTDMTRKTNADVTANITLTKLADYMVADQNGAVIKEYSNAFSTYVTYSFENNGITLFKFRDTSGNETEWLSVSVDNIDKTVPELDYTVEPNKAVTDSGTLETAYGYATIVLSAKSAGDILSGGENDTITVAGAEHGKYITVKSNGNYLIKFADDAGNVNSLTASVSCIDTEPPKATHSGNPESWTNIPPEITVTAEIQRASGIRSYIVQNGAKSDKITFTPTENGTYSFALTNDAGISATYNIEVKYVDVTPPEITYEGTRDVYVNKGEFNKNEFEKMTVSDAESGAVSQTPEIDYGTFDANVPGRYAVTVTGTDNAGNKTVITRNIQVIGEDDVFAAINGNILIPGEQTNYWITDSLDLTFVNAEKSGKKVSYAFVKGYYNGAQLKGHSMKSLVLPNAKIKLEQKEAGMYTLFMQTENRNTQIMYVFIAG